MTAREELMTHLEEMHQALVDWGRYRLRITRKALKADRDQRNMVLYVMMVAIQASIDIGAHIIAARRLERPTTYRETFTILADAGIVPEPLAHRLSELAAFRNVLVHLYWRVNLDRAYEIMQEGYDHLVEFCRLVAATMEESTG